MNFDTGFILNYMKSWIIGIAIFVFSAGICSAQIKEIAQLATLSPTLMVVYNSDMEIYHKHHYLISTIGYMGSYMVLESKWKAALLTLAIGATKELLIDELLNEGTPLWSDMGWNALGISQGIVFTVSLEF